MASNLECVGLAVADDVGLTALIEEVLPAASTVGETDGGSVLRWQDPSGSRLVFEVRGSEVVDFLPSFASAPGARLGSVSFLSDDVASASVLGDDGEQLTVVTLELEERRLLARSAPVTGDAAITALGVDVAVFASPEEFAASDDSLLSADGDGETEPPAHFVEHGWTWPPRVGHESFISYGAFASPDEASAYARLAGSVLTARRHHVELTGQSFVEARVRTVGFEAHVCFPAAPDAGIPAPGSVIHGSVFLVGSIAAPTTTSSPRRRRLFRR